MFHFVYKTMSPSGKYYIGRHSTTVIEDGYLGSGKWVQSYKTPENLHREILLFVETFEDLKREEKRLINENISNPLNMNFNNSSEGWGTGDYNPARTDKERKRRSEESWAKTPEGRKFLSENNPSKMPHVKELRKEQGIKQWVDGTHNFQKPEVKAKILEGNKIRWTENNPMHDPIIAEQVAEKLRQNYKNGNHTFCNPEVRAKSAAAASMRWSEDNPGKWESTREINRERMLSNNPMENPEIKAKMIKSKTGVKLNISPEMLEWKSNWMKNNNPMHNPEHIAKLRKPRVRSTCPHCEKEGGGGAMKRWHFDNCKDKK